MFALRLPKALQDQIADMSKTYGSATPRAFLRELIETVLSGDLAKVNAFNVRLVERVTGQLQLKMEHDLAAVLERTQSTQKAQKAQSTQTKKRKTRKTLKPRRTLKPHRTHERTT